MVVTCLMKKINQNYITGYNVVIAILLLFKSYLSSFLDGIHLYKYLGADDNVVSVIYTHQDSEDS